MFIFSAFSTHAEDKHKKAAEERQKKKDSMSSKEWKEFLKAEKAKREAIKAKREAKKNKQDPNKKSVASKNAKKREVTPVIQEEKQTQIITDEQVEKPVIEKKTKKSPGFIIPQKIEKKVFI